MILRVKERFFVLLKGRLQGKMVGTLVLLVYGCQYLYGMSLIMNIMVFL